MNAKYIIVDSKTNEIISKADTIVLATCIAANVLNESKRRNLAPNSIGYVPAIKIDDRFILYSVCDSKIISFRRAQIDLISTHVRRGDKHISEYLCRDDIEDMD